MSKNFYVLGDDDDKYLKADGSWTDHVDDADHMRLEDALDKQLELFRQGVFVELNEVPLMAEGMYADIHGRVDALQERLAAAGVELETVIGSEDETTWTLRFTSIGLALRLTLDGPDSWEATDEN